TFVSPYCRRESAPTHLGFQISDCAFVVARLVIALPAFAVFLGVIAGCRSVPGLPPADLSTPGWRVHQGQAVWKPGRSRPELAGELLLATNSNGDCFIQFAKPPFTIATARVANDLWQIELGAGDYSNTGRGQPPSHFVWFELSRALAGMRLDRG